MSLIKLPLDEFSRRLASDSPAPGGGSVAALAAGLASALCAMVARLTVGREKYKASWDDMTRVRDEGDRLSELFQGLVDRDTEAYNLVTAAFKLPKSNPEEKAARQKAVNGATLEAARVPLETLKAVHQMVDLVHLAAAKGNPNCITDAGVAAQLALAAANGAAYNVKINISSLSDPNEARPLAEETDKLLAEIKAKTNRIQEEVEKAIE